MIGLFDWRHLLVPFAVRRFKISVDRTHYIGWSVYRLFGWRVALIQETKPWE